MNSLSLTPSPYGFPDFSSLFSPKRDKKNQVNIRENHSGYIVTVKLVGFIIDDIGVTFRDNHLSIMACSSAVRFAMPTSALARPNFYRIIRLERQIKEDEIKYLYEGNLLTIELPKVTPSRRWFLVF